jgi:hypothetical protein
METTDKLLKQKTVTTVQGNKLKGERGHRAGERVDIIQLDGRSVLVSAQHPICRATFRVFWNMGLRVC